MRRAAAASSGRRPADPARCRRTRRKWSTDPTAGPPRTRRAPAWLPGRPARPVRPCRSRVPPYLSGPAGLPGDPVTEIGLRGGTEILGVDDDVLALAELVVDLLFHRRTVVAAAQPRRPRLAGPGTAGKRVGRRFEIPVLSGGVDEVALVDLERRVGVVQVRPAYRAGRPRISYRTAPTAPPSHRARCRSTGSPGCRVRPRCRRPGRCRTPTARRRYAG